MDMLEAEKIAEEFIQSEPFKNYRLSPATREPLRLPGGWRFPYDSFVGPYRVRQCMLILCVDQQGVEVEWDDFAQQPDKVEQLEKVLLETSPTLPLLKDALDRVRSKYPEARIATFEAVLDDKAVDEALLQWRVVIAEGTRQYAVPVYGTHDAPKPAVGEKEEIRAKKAAAEWVMGDIVEYKSDPDTLTVNLEPQVSLRGQWIVWTCMARVTQFVEGLGYCGVGPHNVRVEHVSSDLDTRGADFGIVRGVPTIKFLRQGGWAEDLSVVLHELGHALWALLYTRPPKNIDRDEHDTALDGVQDGFADYFAATLLANGNNAVKIGGSLPDDVANLFDHLPRDVDGKPVEPPASPNRYEIGSVWANLLWDFRSQVGQDKANAVVLSAHIKPRVGDPGLDEPLACYFQSLKETAVHMNVSFDDWDELAEDHNVAH